MYAIRSYYAHERGRQAGFPIGQAIIEAQIEDGPRHLVYWTGSGNGRQEAEAAPLAGAIGALFPRRP